MQSVIGAVKESRGMISGHPFTWVEFNCTILGTIWGPFMQATLRQNAVLRFPRIHRKLSVGTKLPLVLSCRAPPTNEFWKTEFSKKLTAQQKVKVTFSLWCCSALVKNYIFNIS